MYVYRIYTYTRKCIYVYIYITHTYICIDIIYTLIHAMQKTCPRKGNLYLGVWAFPRQNEV